jgi:uncharacterized membrane protein
MTHLRLTEHFEAPIDRVFELGADFKRYPEWNVSYNEVKEVTGPADKVGTRIHGVMRILGRPMEGWGEVVEVERPRMMKIAGTGLEGGHVTTMYRLTPAGTGTDFEAVVDYELPAGVFGKIADKLYVEKATERDLRHSIENFKALAEAKVPIEV